MLLSVSGTINSVAQFLTVLLLFVFVCAVTYFTTKFIASYQKGGMQGTNIELIDVFRIDATKCIQIVRVGEKYIAMAVCKDNVSVLCELSEDEIVRGEHSKGTVSVDFKDIFEKMKQNIKTKKQAVKDE